MSVVATVTRSVRLHELHITVVLGINDVLGNTWAFALKKKNMQSYE
jgi:hypothetical protein